MEQLIAAIYNFSSGDFDHGLFQQHTLETLLQPDGDRLDVLHHAILANNPDVLPLLLEKGFGFQPPVSIVPTETFFGYLHLASTVSESAVLKQLCELPNCAVGVGCSRKCWPDSEVLLSHMRRGQYATLTPEELDLWSAAYNRVKLGNCRDLLFPVDVAALFENNWSLQILLSTGTSKKLSKLEQAIELNSITALQFLLSKSPEPAAVNSALKFCIGRRRVELLRVLFDYGVNIKKALNDMNPYHVLYLSSLSQVRIRNPVDLNYRNQGVVGITSLLVERGFDVNVRRPFGTYPLYSLITALVQEKDNSPTVVPVHHIEALEIILRANANGNFDEVRFLKDTGIPIESVRYTGRELSTSMLNCYFTCLQSSDTWRPHIMEHLDRLCLTLLESGANPDYVDAWGRTPLHDLMQAMASQNAMGHMHADLSTMSRMLLYFGANPNCKTTDGDEYPVEYYFSKILAVMGGIFAFGRWKSSNNIPQVLNLLYFMDTEDANAAYHNILTLMSNARANGNADNMPEDVSCYVVSLMKEYVCSPKSLQDLTRLTLWKAVSRKVHNLRRLRMPKAFLSSIKDLFALDV